MNLAPQPTVKSAERLVTYIELNYLPIESLGSFVGVIMERKKIKHKNTEGLIPSCIW